MPKRMLAAALLASLASWLAWLAFSAFCLVMAAISSSEAEVSSRLAACSEDPSARDWLAAETWPEAEARFRQVDVALLPVGSLEQPPMQLYLLVPHSAVASAKRDAMRLISVVMGTASEKARARESQALLNYGFRFFETHRLYGAASTLYPKLTAHDMLLSNGVVLALGFLASLSPAWRASRYEPVEAITKVG